MPLEFFEFKVSEIVSGCQGKSKWENTIDKGVMDPCTPPSYHGNLIV